MQFRSRRHSKLRSCSLHPRKTPSYQYSPALWRCDLSMAVRQSSTSPNSTMECLHACPTMLSYLLLPSPVTTPHLRSTSRVQVTSRPVRTWSNGRSFRSLAAQTSLRCTSSKFEFVLAVFSLRVIQPRARLTLAPGSQSMGYCPPLLLPWPP